MHEMDCAGIDGLPRRMVSYAQMKMRFLLAILVVSLGCPAFQADDVVVLSGPWEMQQKSARGKWMPAVVPGTVLTTLVKNWVVPDPYYGLNNKIGEGRIPDVGMGARDFYTVTYRTKVTIPENWKRKTVWLRPEGINYHGEIRLNGQVATTTTGTFARNAVDVSEFLRPGVNDVEVEVRPVDHPGKPFQKPWGAPGEWSNGGDGEIGRDVTVLMGAGWDFMFSDGIRDRHVGIWKDIVLFATDKIRIDAPYVRTKLNDAMDEAELTLEVDLVNASQKWGDTLSGVLEAEVAGTDVRFSKRMSFYRGERRTEFLTAKLKNPKLWWPRNKGPQNLYTLNVQFVLDAYKEYDRVADRQYEVPGCVSDSKTIRFGVREFTSDQSGEDGARQFYVNRRKIFIRGTNWIPEGMLRQDDERMEAEMRLTAESGVNLVRLWAGGITESDRFYELCDEYGLLVWQEFWMTGDTRHPDNPGLYLDSVAQQVKRIRHHASIAHWVCSNESTDVQGVEELVKSLTGTTSWMQNSECDGVHDGSPYYPVNSMRHYLDCASSRGRRIYGFSPEYGTCALPPAECCREFMPEELLWPVEKNVEAWKYREGGGFDRMTEFHHAAVNAYGKSSSFDEYARKSQAADALAHRCLWEAWNRARNTATGVLFWYNNTPVPQLGGHAWDHSLVCTASQFAQANALEPLHAQYEYLSNRVSIVSDIYEARNLSVKAEVYDFESRKVWERSAKVNVPGETHVDVFAIPFGAELALNFDKPHFVKLRLMEGAREIASTFYWRSNSVYAGPESATGPCVGGFEDLDTLPKTTLAARQLSDEGGKLTVEVENAGDKLAFMVEVRLEGEDGKYLKPVFYSDNFFALLPGEKKTITANHPAAKFNWRAKAWNSK